MTWPDCDDFHFSNGTHHNGRSNRARLRLSRDLLTGRYRKGESLRLSRIAAEYDLDCHSAALLLSDLCALGMVSFSTQNLAIVRSSNPNEMYEAYAIRAALEEISGRAAAVRLKGNTAVLQRGLADMRAAVRNQDLDSLAEHDVNFHRSVLEASGNDVLLRVWDSLAFDIRIRTTIAYAMGDLPDVVESHQPIIDALERGQGREAGLLLRNHVETFLQFLKKADMDAAFFRQDLEIARNVQKALIPQEAPLIPGLSCDMFYKPAHSVGGDYYDFLSLESGRWGIAIGDVSGKGIGAALVMASLQASLRAQALQSYCDPATLINHVNHLVHESSPVQFYASLFYGDYDPATRILKYVNAGHNPPIVVRCHDRRSKVLRLLLGSKPVGMFQGSAYKSEVFRLEDGDIIIACTDGIIEAENHNGEHWGQQRLEGLFSSRGWQTSNQVLARIVSEVLGFANGTPQRDDMTLLVMRVQAG